ncbi:hypothetical protein PLESTM_001013500 [Pleodorina starrii]|nr:hypothetical protein PLESTM_001013500 [Pleodorina starrii]
MGVDYIARKSAKKRKKKERQAVGKDGVAKQRERRRKKIRRLCQGVCYKAPELTEEDKRWSDREDFDVGSPDSDIEEAVARANSHRGASTSGAALAEAGTAISQHHPSAKNKTDCRNGSKDKRKRADGVAADAATDVDGEAAGNGGKPVLSTAVKLLDPAVLAQNARQAALRKLPAGAKADALEGFPPLLQACMLTLHHVEPTPVQERCWPPALEGRDVQGVAEPGSGKTLAYLLPGFVRLQAKDHTAASLPEGPAMLVLLPTRELAQQVAAQCRAARAVTGLQTVCVFGGAPREEQAALLASKQPHVLVATPGRVLDLVDGGELKLAGHVRYLVLDEADKMLSLGFKPQLDRLYGMLLKPYDDEAAVPAAPAAGKKKAAKAKVAAAAAAAASQPQQPPAAAAATDGGPGQRPQVLLFSATMPSSVSAAAAQWLRRPEEVQVSSSGANAISRTITQVVHVCAEHKKPEKLLKHLARVRQSVPPGCRNPPRLLVFANRVKTVRFLTSTLAKEGYKVAQLHGQRSQTERNQAVSDFRSGKAQVLVATDVAARGLDIRALPYVVNYDFPSRLETYVHRVGRTGRLAAYGHAYSFFTRNLAPLAPPLLELLQAHGQAVDPNLAVLAAAWKVAEEKLGGSAAARAAAAAAAGGGDASGDGDEDGEDDDEGDAAAAAAEAGEGLSLAEEVLLAADDLMEGLGPQDALAIAAIVKKKLAGGGKGARKHSEAPPAGGAAAADVSRPGKKQRREAEEEAPELAAAVAKKGREGDTQLVPTSKEQRQAMQRNQQQQQPGGGCGVAGRQAAFVPAKAFSGAMAGYAFKKGPQGLGYYLDKHQANGPKAEAGRGGPKAAAPAAAGAAKKAPAVAAKGDKGKAAGDARDPEQFGKGKGMAAASKPAPKVAASEGLPTRNKPIIPVRHSDFLSDSDDDGGGGGGKGRRVTESKSEEEAPPRAAAAVGGKRDGKARAGEGVKARAGAGRSAAAARGDGSVRPTHNGAADDDSDGDDGDFPSGGKRAAAKRKYKAVPGRLRKKLKAQGQKHAGGGE